MILRTTPEPQLWILVGAALNSDCVCQHPAGGGVRRAVQVCRPLQCLSSTCADTLLSHSGDSVDTLSAPFLAVEE